MWRRFPTGDDRILTSSASLGNFDVLTFAHLYVLTFTREARLHRPSTIPRPLPHGRGSVCSFRRFDFSAFRRFPRPEFRKCFIHRMLRSNRFIEASAVQVLIKTARWRLTRRSELLKYVARPGGCKRNAAALGTRCSLTIEEVDAGPPSVIEFGLLRDRSQPLGGLWYCGNEPLVLTSRVAVRRLCGRGSGGTVPRNLKRWKSD